MISLRVSGWKTLHQVGACWRQPNLDYLVHSQHGDVLPEPAKYHAVCKTCFLKAEGRLPVADPEDSASEGSSSSGEGV